MFPRRRVSGGNSGRRSETNDLFVPVWFRVETGMKTERKSIGSFF